MHVYTLWFYRNFNSLIKSNCIPCLGQRGKKTYPQCPGVRPRIAQRSMTAASWRFRGVCEEDLDKNFK